MLEWILLSFVTLLKINTKTQELYVTASIAIKLIQYTSQKM